ncbi:MAG: DNA polymerase III subunit delta [Armatimonadetes bacterium]|nr:DNA polymerase III subunit delta [Armatimonadota bacterium]
MPAGKKSPQTAGKREGPKAGAAPVTPERRERITLLVGRNVPARTARLNRIVEESVDAEWRDFNYSELEAREVSAPDLLMMLAQVSVGDPEKHRTLVLRGVERLRASEAEALAAILPRVPEPARLILVAEGDKTGRETRLSSRLLKAVEAEGRVFDFPPLRPNEAPALVSARAKEMGLRLAPDVPRLLAMRVGADATVIERELEKLRSAVGPEETVTADRVEAVVAPSAEHTIFELTDAVGERNARKALESMQSLLAAGQSVYMLLPMIARQLRLVWQVKAAMEGLPDAELKDPSPARLGDWQKQKLQRQARTFTWAALEEGMTALFEIDLAIKGIEEGGEDPRALLETLILRLCGVGGVRLVQPLH